MGRSLRHAAGLALLGLLVLAGTLPALAESRIALVITNQAYAQPGARLTATHRDGDLVKAALEKVGFRVFVVRDTRNEGELLRAIGEHVERLAQAGPDAVGFLYYSGHGAADRPDGANYLIPTEVPLATAAQLDLMAVRLDKITSALSKVGRMSFIVFDACRNVALQRGLRDATFKGFAPVREQNGLLLAFATDPGNVAVDESHYARALAEGIVQPGLEAAQVFRRVRQRVRDATGGRQAPEYVDKREHDFHFVANEQPSELAGPRIEAEAARLAAIKAEENRRKAETKNKADQLAKAKADAEAKKKADEERARRETLAKAKAEQVAAETKRKEAEAQSGSDQLLTDVSGAPGDGNSSLAAAMRRELRLAGVGWAVQRGYRVAGRVQIGAVANEKQAIRIDWRITYRGGRLYATVSQNNEIAAGSLNGAWGTVAEDAAQGVFPRIKQLLDEMKNTGQ